MFFPSEPSIYQQILGIDDVLVQQQQQQQLQLAHQQQKQQQFQYEMARIGLGTPPTSPPAPAFHNYNGVPTEIGTMYYEPQGQAIHNVYVTPTPVSLIQQQPQQQPSLPHKPDTKLEQELAYLELMQQFDNLESSLFSHSPNNSSSCSSSLSNSPYAESPLSAISADFDLFPMNNNISAPQRQQQQQPSMSYPSVPIMAPLAATSSQYGQPNVYHQMTPPMHQMDLEREACSLFRHDPNLPLTADMSQLCKCPGQYPCGEAVQEVATSPSPVPSSIPQTSSPLQNISEDDFSESDSGSEGDQDWDPSYLPSRARSAVGTAVTRSTAGGPRSRADKVRPKSLVISSSVSSTPYSKEATHSPVRQDRRRSSSGAYSSGGSQQLLEPEMLPKITDIHVCPVCARRFSRPFNLRSHIMTHTTARPYACDECHWSFTRQHDLLRHKRAKHPNSVISTAGGHKNESTPKTGA
ncbi:hypothetical protein BGX23_009574 [Mortierella sp. AD031]|nr:hypothetical protein BGX23_009574 [Mortierella sp. AD031]